MRRSRRRSFELEADVVQVAVVPILARFVGADDRVPGAAEVRSRVLARRVVAAPDVAALLAHAQMHPVPAAGGGALDAPGPGGRDVADLIQVGAVLVHSGLPHARRSTPVAVRVERMT